MVAAQVDATNSGCGAYGCGEDGGDGPGAGGRVGRRIQARELSVFSVRSEKQNEVLRKSGVGAGIWAVGGGAVAVALSGMSSAAVHQAVHGISRGRVTTWPAERAALRKRCRRSCRETRTKFSGRAELAQASGLWAAVHGVSRGRVTTSPAERAALRKRSRRSRRSRRETRTKFSGKPELSRASGLGRPSTGSPAVA